MDKSRMYWRKLHWRWPDCGVAWATSGFLRSTSVETIIASLDAGFVKQVNQCTEIKMLPSAFRAATVNLQKQKTITLSSL